MNPFVTFLRWMYLRGYEAGFIFCYVVDLGANVVSNNLQAVFYHALIATIHEKLSRVGVLKQMLSKNDGNLLTQGSSKLYQFLGVYQSFLMWNLDFYFDSDYGSNFKMHFPATQGGRSSQGFKAPEFLTTYEPEIVRTTCSAIMSNSKTSLRKNLSDEEKNSVSIRKTELFRRLYKLELVDRQVPKAFPKEPEE